MTYTDAQIGKAVRVMELLGWTTVEGTNPNGTKYVTLRRFDDRIRWPYVSNSANGSRAFTEDMALEYGARHLLNTGYFSALAWNLPFHPQAKEYDLYGIGVSRWCFVSIDGADWAGPVEADNPVDLTLDLLLAVLPRLEGKNDPA